MKRVELSILGQVRVRFFTLWGDGEALVPATTASAPLFRGREVRSPLLARLGLGHAHVLPPVGVAPLVERLEADEVDTRREPVPFHPDEHHPRVDGRAL